MMDKTISNACLVFYLRNLHQALYDGEYCSHMADGCLIVQSYLELLQTKFIAVNGFRVVLFCRGLHRKTKKILPRELEAGARF